MQDQLPPLTHLQFLILGTLLDGELSGRAMREALAEYGIRRSAAAFYQIMARLERAGLVQGWYEQITVGDQAVTERRYRLEPPGERDWDETRRFYEVAGQRFARQRWSDA